MTDAKKIKIALAGNPNSGKTSIFNALTGAHQKVANFPGVTVEKRIGHRRFNGYDITLVDLPGTYSLTAYSPDEKVAREFILEEKPDVVINVIDSGSLERSLYLTTQLIEMGVDLVVDLNMWDEICEAGIEIDVDKLSLLLGAPVVKTIGSRGQGVESLLESALVLAQNGQKIHHHPPVSYGPALDDLVNQLSGCVSACSGCSGCGQPRWLAVKLLEGDQEIKNKVLVPGNGVRELHETLDKSLAHLKKTTRDDPEIIVSEGRYGYVAGIIREVLKRPLTDRMRISTQADNILTHRLLGYPIFFIIMWLIFEATFVLGQYPMDWIDSGVGWLQAAVAGILPATIWSNLIVDGIIGGVGSVIVFLPNIVILFLGIALLEDSGYMARAAFLMDRLMHFLGLHGKSFIPMLMGFGCSVPGIMAARTLESPRDRILTILLVPLMSCSARLPVYLLFAGAFFGATAGTVIFSMYLIGIIAAIAMARILQKTILPTETTPFVMELPPYRMPTGKSILIHMWDRSKLYLHKMGGVILIASVVLWALGYFPRKTEFSIAYDTRIAQLQSGATESGDAADMAGEIARLENLKSAEELEYSYIGRLGEAIDPFVSPLGFNWQMGVALVPGFIAKEVVVSSLGVLYQMGETEDIGGLIEVLRHPEEGITPLAAYAYMIFVLLYTPCIATVVVIRKEIGWKWMWFSTVMQLILAWGGAFIIYQGGKLLGWG